MADARADVLIVGGGVAGLWIRYELERRGWSVLLCEACALGAGQTVASQGILHAGVKYHLSAAAREASRALAEARESWFGALSGKGPDLSRVAVLSRHTYFWSAGMVGRATGDAAALAMRSDVRRLDESEYPGALRGAPPSVGVWQAAEACIDSTSLVSELARAAKGPAVRASCAVVNERAEGVEARCAAAPGDEFIVDAGAVVLAAGAGNEALFGEPGAMQRRPLHMVLLRGAPAPLFGHSLRAGSDKPRITVTSAEHGGEIVWYLGGELAESGVERDAHAQLSAAREELKHLLGWIDLGPAKLAALRVDRAEGRTPDGRRPDSVVLRRRSRVLSVWPTKLALAPAAAALVAREVEALGVPATGESVSPTLPPPNIALPPWAWEGLEWT